MTPRSPPPLRPGHWPAPLINGLSIGAGLVLLCGGVAAIAGVPAALMASSGAAAASVADTVCTPQDKRHQMLPAVLGCLLVSVLVAFTHAQPWALSAVSLLVIFCSLGWLAWGKRGGPLAFANVLALVIQSAAWQHAPAATSTNDMLQHLQWVAVGAVGMGLWSQFTAWLLAARYRHLALATSLDALARLMHHQARWTAQATSPTQRQEATGALLALIRDQAGLPETLQTARDLIYSQAQGGNLPLRTRQAIESLAQAVRLRDVLMGCQLDLEAPPPGPASCAAIGHLAQRLQAEARRMADVAAAWRGRPRPLALRDPDVSDAPAGTTPASSAADQALHDALQRRMLHLSWLMDAIDAATPVLAGSLAHEASTRIPSPLPPVDVSGQAAVLRAMTTNPRWPLAALKAQLRTSSPVLRHAARTTLACGCALALGHVMPWASHPHWILLTVAVVMRGSLEQTLLRRNARVLGTLVGCLIAGALVTLMPSPLGLLLALALAVSLAHGYVLIDYRITSAAGAVLALLQGHLLAHGHVSVWMDVAERLGDTLLGAALAWGFSHVWPAWERLTLPRQVGRLLECLARDATQALAVWPEGATATVRHAPLDRHLARRDTQEALAQLTQALGRMSKEPLRARVIAPEVEQLLLHSHRLSSLIAGVRGLVALKLPQLAPEVAQPAMARTHKVLVQAFRGTRPDAPPPPLEQATAPTPLDRLAPLLDPALGPSPFDDDLPPAEGDALGGPDVATTTAWLLHRLAQMRQAARDVAQAARPLRALHEAD